LLFLNLHRADSVTWNPHKMLTAPQQCSTFLTKHERVLTESNSSCAQYLFQKDKFYDTTYDTGDKHIQCGRRADVFKFWFMWKAKVRSPPTPNAKKKKLINWRINLNICTKNCFINRNNNNDATIILIC